MKENNTEHNTIIPLKLPCEAYEEKRRLLAPAPEIKSTLGRFGSLVVRAQRGQVSNYPLNGFLLFKGRPGCGKTMTAGALAQALAIRHKQLFGRDTFLFELRLMIFTGIGLLRSLAAVGRRSEINSLNRSIEERDRIITGLRRQLALSNSRMETIRRRLQDLERVLEQVEQQPRATVGRLRLDHHGRLIEVP